MTGSNLCFAGPAENLVQMGSAIASRDGDRMIVSAFDLSRSLRPVASHPEVLSRVARIMPDVVEGAKIVRAGGEEIPVFGAVVGAVFGMGEIGKELYYMGHGKSNPLKVVAVTAANLAETGGDLIDMGIPARELVVAGEENILGVRNSAPHSAAVSTAGKVIDALGQEAAQVQLKPGVPLAVQISHTRTVDAKLAKEVQGVVERAHAPDPKLAQEIQHTVQDAAARRPNPIAAQLTHPSSEAVKEAAEKFRRAEKGEGVYITAAPASKTPEKAL